MDSKKWPSRKQWLQFFKVSDKKEKIAFGILFLIFISSISFLLHSNYIKNTIIVPADYGYIKEGVIGNPQFINPLYSSISDTDKDLVELIFSGLMTYNDQGKIVPDLIETYNIEENGKSIVFSIKENVKWHDGLPLTIDDVIFTIDLVKDSEYLSPLRTNWQGVEIEKMSEYKAVLKLTQVYSGFEESLVNLKIMPKHIWNGLSVQAMTTNNILNPIGSGPYSVKKINYNKDKTIKSIVLQSNLRYYNRHPYIKSIEFIFFDNQNELVNNLKSKKIDSAMISKEYSDDFDGYSLETPDYFTLFLNNQKKPLDNKNIRQSLSLLTNKEEIAEITKEEIVNSPFLSSFYGLKEGEKVFSYNEEEGIKLLESEGYLLEEGSRIKTIEKSSGFKFSQVLQVGSNNTEVRKLQECLSDDPEIYPSGNISGYFGQETKSAVILFQEKYKEEILVPNNLTKGNGVVKASTIKKLNEVCFVIPGEKIEMSFVLKTTNHPLLVSVAEKIKEQWEKQGIKIEIKTFDTNSIKKVLRDRDFDILLFGKKLGGILNPIPFWHSSQRVDPGLNLSLYQNTKADTLMEKSRISYNEEDRSSIFEELEALIIEDAPTIPLYRSSYIYVTNNNLKGFTVEKIAEPSKRFVSINNWYIKEKRIYGK